MFIEASASVRLILATACRETDLCPEMQVNEIQCTLLLFLAVLIFFTFCWMVREVYQKELHAR